MLVVLIPDDNVWTDVLSLPPPELPPDEAVQHGQAEHGQEKEDAGGPDHDGEQPRADGVLCGSALVGAQGVRAVLVLDPHQDEDGASAEEGDGPEDENDQLDLPLGDDDFSSQGEADGDVPLHAERRDVEDGGVGAALADELEELAEEVPEVPGPILPEAEEVQGHAEEDEQVGEGHAGQVEVGGGSHVPEPRHHQHGHEVADDPDDEEQDAGDGDAGEHGHGEQVQRGLGARPVLRTAAARVPLPHPGAAGCASPPGAAPRGPRCARAGAGRDGQGRAGTGGPAPPLLAPPLPPARAGGRCRASQETWARSDPRARSLPPPSRQTFFPSPREEQHGSARAGSAPVPAPPPARLGRCGCCRSVLPEPRCCPQVPLCPRSRSGVPAPAGAVSALSPHTSPRGAQHTRPVPQPRVRSLPPRSVSLLCPWIQFSEAAAVTRFYVIYLQLNFDSAR